MYRRLALPSAAAVTALLVLPVGVAEAQGDAADFSASGVQDHLNAFQNIADTNNGSRGVGSSGYQASVDYVKGKLEAAGYSVRVQTFSTYKGQSSNVIAEMAGTTPGPVVMMGAHLDSADNAGINDNGSGSAGILDTAIDYAASGQKPRNTVRFAFWGAEEIGLVGSSHYVNSLSTTDRSKIKAYVNVDMIGSKNPGYFVYDDNPAGNFIRDDLSAYFATKSHGSEYVDVQGRSDHAAFIKRGIPTGGVFSGGDATKTSAQASKWGGTAGIAFDTCYHRKCDDISNIDPTVLTNHTAALGHIMGKYAAQEFTATKIKGKAKQPAA